MKRKMLYRHLPYPAGTAFHDKNSFRKTLKGYFSRRLVKTVKQTAGGGIDVNAFGQRSAYMQYPAADIYLCGRSRKR